MRRFLNRRNVIGGVLIGVGLVLTVVYGVRSVQSYRQVQYAREQGLDDGTAGVEAIRPWMTMQYVSVAYGVPIEYLFAELDIPVERRNVNETVGEINRIYDFGVSVGEGTTDAPPELPIEPLMREAIEAYQANPVATGLRDVRPWMTIRYIANSTGVPEEYILAQLGITDEDNHLFLPLNELAEEMRYEGGPRRLGDDLTEILTAYEGGE